MAGEIKSLTEVAADLEAAVDQEAAEIQSVKDFLERLKEALANAGAGSDAAVSAAVASIEASIARIEAFVTPADSGAHPDHTLPGDLPTPAPKK